MGFIYDKKKYANTFNKFATRSPSLMKPVVILQLSLVVIIDIKDTSIELLSLQKKTPALRLGFNLS
jgi:hypothetical protein